MREITNFSNIMTIAINNNILTNESMKNSDLFTIFWLACRDLSKAIVKANFAKTEKARKLMAWDYEDVVSEFSLLIERKFETQVKAILNAKMDGNARTKKHSFYGYATTMLLNFLNDVIERYAIKIKEDYVDENKQKHHRTVNAKTVDRLGVAHNIYWNFESMSRPISDDGTLTLGDTLVSDTYDPEATAIAKYYEISRKKEYFECLKKICAMKSYLGCAYVYIEDKLTEDSIPCSLKSVLEIFDKIEYKSPLFQLAAQKAFVRAYNNDLVKFVDSISENNISDEAVEFIFTHYAKTFEDFGRVNHIDADTIYHRRNEYKKALSRIKTIEASKKYAKKIK